MIALRVGSYYSVRLPAPSQRFEVPVTTPMSVEGKAVDVVSGSRTVRVTREAEVTQYLGEAVVTLPALDREELGTFAGELGFPVTNPSGVRSVSDAIDHFALEHGQRVEDPEVRDCAWGSVVTFDLSRHGWVPGNTFVYLVPRDPKRGAVFLNGTFFLEFDWDAVSVA